MGGDYTLVYEGTANVYTNTIGSDYLECGTLYYLKVTAVNYAGESSPQFANIRVGSVPTVPLNLRWTAIVPSVSVTLKWEPPVDNGCLPITGYIINKDGTDLSATISADSVSYADSISTGGTVGTSIVYKIKAVNVAGASIWSQPLTVTVGQVPNAPTALTILSQPTQTSAIVSWTADVAITNNPSTTAYKLYVDDLSGNGP